MKYKATLDIIIVNWNSKTYLYNCLQSISQIENENFYLKHVIIVDNGSHDESLYNIENINLPIQLKLNKSNLGFAKACNQGAENSEADYLLFLNPDTELYNNTLDKIIEFMQREENYNIALCGPQLITDNNQIQKTSTRNLKFKHIINISFGLHAVLPKHFESHHMTEWSHDSSREVDHVIGAFYLIRNSIFQKIKGFDERYFVYLEDLDLSYRLKQENNNIYYLSEAKAYHKGGGTSDQVKAKRLFYSLRSRILYGYKHFSKPKAIIAMFLTYLIEPFTRILYAIIKRQPMQIKETIEGYYLLYKDTHNILKIIKQ